MLSNQRKIDILNNMLIIESRFDELAYVHVTNSKENLFKLGALGFSEEQIAAASNAEVIDLVPLANDIGAKLTTRSNAIYFK